MSGTECIVKMRPFPNDTELQCQLDDGHVGEHQAVLKDYAYEGSETTITWDDGDRRCFEGVWPGQCGADGCVLPLGHHGRHAA